MMTNVHCISQNMLVLRDTWLIQHSTIVNQLKQLLPNLKEHSYNTKTKLFGIMMYNRQRYNSQIQQIKQMKNHMRDESRLWDYEILEQLGRGEYGQVYKVRNKKDNKFYALKRVNISSCHEKQKIQAFRQIKALKLIQHPDIIQSYESFLSMDNIYIVMEYAAKGDFSKIVKDRKLKEKNFSQQQLWQIFASLAGAIKYLHQKGIIHRDLKLQNIFMTQSGKVKIGDLGMCKVVNKSNQLISTRVGTPMYFAPEIIQHQMYSYPVDVWALGCVFYNLATLQHPFKDATIQTLPYYVIDRDPKPIKGQYGGNLINFINNLLIKNSKDRPNIFEVNLSIKNREKPSPQNQIKVFDYKKLLMINSDIEKLDKLKKNYTKKSIKRAASTGHESSLSKIDRYISTSQVKTYRDYIKYNQSFTKLNSKIELNEPSSPTISLKHRNSCRVQANSLSLLVSNIKSVDISQQPLSPIKTNGFGSPNKINNRINNNIQSVKSSFVQQKYPMRNFAAKRQQFRKPIPN